MMPNPSFMDVLRSAISDHEYYDKHYVVEEPPDEEPLDSRNLVTVYATDIAPSITAANAMGIALQEISTCKDMFQRWSDTLNKHASARPRDLERDLIVSVEDLSEEASKSLQSTRELLKTHERFSKRMDSLLVDAAGHPNGEVQRPTELLALGEQIMAHSSTLAEHSQAMQTQLRFVLSIVKKIQSQERRNKWWSGLLSFLRKAFNILAVVLSAAALAVPMLISGVSSTVDSSLGAGAALATAAATVSSQMSDEDEESNFEKIMAFLDKTIPSEIAKAEKSLAKFQECQSVVQMDVKMKNGECVRMSRYDAELAREQWREHRHNLRRMIQVAA